MQIVKVFFFGRSVFEKLENIFCRRLDKVCEIFLSLL